MTEDRFQRIRSKYRGFGMVVYNIDSNSVIAIGDTRKKLTEQLQNTNYSITDDKNIVLRCETDEYV
jgi:hypothetical protein